MSHQYSDRLRAFRVYLAVTILANLAWETLQLPLYTIWTSGTVGERVFAIVHCTGGDMLIALSSLVASLIVVGSPGWPRERFGQVAVLAIAFGFAYTGFSEWLNVSVRKSWAYSDWMPVIPVAGGIGLSPLLQWLVIPAGAFWAVRLQVRPHSDQRGTATPE
jgi:hypothetical protein